MKSIIFLGKNVFERNPFHYSFVHDDSFKTVFNDLKYEYRLVRYLSNLDKSSYIVISDIENTPSLTIVLLRGLRNPKVLVYEFIVLMKNFKKKAKSYILFKLTPRENKILIALESPLHSPENHNVKLYKRFGTILTWNKPNTDNRSIIYTPWPQKDIDSKLNLEKTNDRKENICAVYSFFPKSGKKDLYSKRQEFINNWNENYPQIQIDIYGKGWESDSRFKNQYFGIAEDKLEKLKEYKYSLVFENLNSSYYVTEKIFDSLKAGCIPIYYGCSEVNHLVPEHLFIRITDLENLTDIYQKLTQLNGEDFNNFLERNNEYLKSDNWRINTSRNLAKKIITRIKV
jgi:alpha(1,3/1,4) fucosyltransferase